MKTNIINNSIKYNSMDTYDKREILEDNKNKLNKIKGKVTEGNRRCPCK